MTNLEYLESVKKGDENLKLYIKKKNGEEDYRQVKALEIIAEELCIMNATKVTIPKIKIIIPEEGKKDLGV